MEYQAKELFAKHDVAVTLGIVANTPAEARAAAEELGVVVVKAQVKAGGRGKAGGVKLAKTPDEAEAHAEAILGMEIKGLTVNRVLIAPAASIEEEYYFSFLLDRANRQYLCIASVEGGVEIEEVAKTNPEAVKQIPVDPGSGVDEEKAKAKEKGLNYVKLDGEVGIIGNGAGLVMSTLDVVAYAGEAHGGVKPANFLDIGDGANAQVMADGLDVILNDSQVKSVFVNVLGGITACDEVAKGIVGALEILGDEENKPLVVRLDGNNVAEGRRILTEANHPLVTLVDTMDGAADKAAELANV